MEDKTLMRNLTEYTGVSDLADKLKNFTQMGTHIPDVSLVPHIKPIEFPEIQSVEERFKFMSDRMDTMTDELKNQTIELQRLEYENEKLNNQVFIQTEVIERQLEEIKEQKAVNSKLKQINESLEASNKHSFRNGILIGLIPAAIILVLTVILTYFGWL